MMLKLGRGALEFDPRQSIKLFPLIVNQPRERETFDEEMLRRLRNDRTKTVER